MMTPITIEQQTDAITAALAGDATKPGATEAGKRVDMLEAEILKQPQVDLPLRHYFAAGVYAREIQIPAGTLLTGKIHKTEHLNIISKGKIAVWTETEGVQRISAPFTFVAAPGTRRVGYAIEDTVWTTIHGTHETDLVKLEAKLIQPRDQVTLTGEKTLWLGCIQAPPLAAPSLAI